MLIRVGGSALLALSLFSCGEDAGAPAYDPYAPVRTAVPLAIAVSPDGLGPLDSTSPAAAPLAFGGSPYGLQSGVLSPTTSTPEAEEHIAINPLNSCVWVAAVSDFSIRGGFNTTKYAVTYDFATTWQEAFLPVSGAGNGGSVITSDGQAFDANSDPVVAFDRLGNVYIVNLYINQGSKKNGIYVSVKSVGSSGPLTFSSADVLPVVKNVSNPVTNSEDKEWIAVDNSTGSSTFKGRVYVSWSRFNTSGTGSRIMLTWSGNQAGTWSAPIQLSPVSQNGAVQGSQVAVGPDGTVYVAYDVAVVGGHQVFFTKSTDGGVTWPTPVSITPIFTEVNFTSSYRKDSFPSLAMNPAPVSGQTYGEIYVVYPDQAGANSEIKFISSTVNGTTFSAPIAINDVSTGQRLMPSITADDRNNIHVAWFDTRNGSDAQTYDIYATRGSFSTGSLLFSSNARVTPSSMTTGSSFIGDYGGIASSSLDDAGVLWGFAVPVWTGSGSSRILKTALLAYTNP